MARGVDQWFTGPQVYVTLLLVPSSFRKAWQKLHTASIMVLRLNACCFEELQGVDQTFSGASILQLWPSKMTNRTTGAWTLKTSSSFSGVRRWHRKR